MVLRYFTTLAEIVVRSITTNIPADLLALAVKYSGVATLGSLLLGYGLREFLRAMGGGYYCCNHAGFALFGIAIMLPGWMLVLIGLAGPVQELYNS